MMPSDFRPRDGKNESIDRKSDTRCRGNCVAVAEGESGFDIEVGRALSFALRLKNRKSGANHTHIPKKVAISVKEGGEGV